MHFFSLNTSHQNVSLKNNSYIFGIDFINSGFFFSVLAGSEKELPQDQQGSVPNVMERQGSGMAKRLATLLSGLVECMCFAGIIFGWASLVYVLKDLHYFEDLCVPSANQTANRTSYAGMVTEEAWWELIVCLYSLYIVWD